jgi:exonuclease III
VNTNPTSKNFKYGSHNNNKSYYSEAEFDNKFNTLKNMKHKLYSLYHLNIRSLNKNIDKFLVHINTLKHKFNIIILTEIWITNIQIITNKFENYNIHINTPNEKKAGGVAILIKKDIPYNLINELQACNNSIETIAIKTNINNKTHVIIGIYKHPNTNSNIINEYINHTMQNITTNYNTIIMGDININLMDTENKDTILYTNNMNNNKLLPLIDAPTRITNNTATIIDHIYI